MGDLHAFDLILFVAATFAAAFVAGLAGFAFGIDAVNVPATKRIRSKA